MFGGVIALRGAEVTLDDDGREVGVALWWEVLSPVEVDYTVFVHLIDDTGNLAANGDGPPLAGGFPTGMWEPGDTVVDRHVIEITSDLPPGDYDVVVGWYDPATGVRLASGDGDSVRLGQPVRVP
jgi:hypothetical protein